MQKVTAMEELFERDCCIRGYHGELVVCERKPENASDRYAVAVKKELS